MRATLNIKLPVGLDLAAHDLFLCHKCDTLGDIEDSVSAGDGVVPWGRVLLCTVCAEGVSDEG